MSENVVTSRGPVDRFYVMDNSKIVVRHKDQPDREFDVGSLSPDLLRLFAIEGIVHLTQRSNKSVEDIVSGGDGVFPDRSLPSGTSVQKESYLSQAIAQVRADDMMKAAKAAGGKLDRTTALAKATEWVAGLSKEARNKAKNVPAVIKAVAAFRAAEHTSAGSLEDVLGSDDTIF